jgi:YHS domain-containing protein
MLQLVGRLILLLIIISVIRSLLKTVLRFWAGFAGARARPSVSRETPVGHLSLQQDPVCGTYVAVDTSLKRIVRGKVVHFCSPECRDKYEVEAQ